MEKQADRYWKPPQAQLLLRGNQQAKQSDFFREMTVSEIRAVEGDGNERKRILSFSSEEPYERWDGPEVLDHAPGAVDLKRITEMGCLLFNHDRNRVVGKVCRAWLENNRALAEVEFDTDADSETIFQKVKSGTLKGVSTGYRITSKEIVSAGEVSKDGRFHGPATIARRWIPLEISIVSIPADATVGVGRQMDDDDSKAQVRCVSVDFLQRQLQVNKNSLRERGM